MAITWTDYMDANEYQNYFDKQVNKKQYPVAIRGKFIKGINKYKAIFVPFQPGTFYFYHSNPRKPLPLGGG
ncbi:MAG: hypothetical protein GF329_03050 [Candidatus Lokiarchaeota archaeon]|nr:hypothetical protein [Candidatus Lokiarchaeota archaeon]